MTTALLCWLAFAVGIGVGILLTSDYPPADAQDEVSRGYW